MNLNFKLKMNSKYIKKSENSIKKSKSEINFHINYDKINIEKIQKKINPKNALLDPEISKNSSLLEKNSKSSSEETDLNLNENKNYIIKSIESEKNQKNESKEKSPKDININLKKVFYNFNSDNYCQCCNKKFNDKMHSPLLLKCKHIFCKTCLGKYFITDDNIICPIDGYVGKTYEVLNNINKNNRSKRSNKNKNYLNSIKSLFHKSESHKELLSYKNNKNNDSIKKKNHKINLLDKINNFMSNNINSNNKNRNNKIPYYFNLTNKNEELNENLFHKKNFNFCNTKNSQNKFNKTSNYIPNNELMMDKFHKIKNISHKKRNKFRSRSTFNDNNNINNLNNISHTESNEEENEGNFCSIHPEQRISHFVEDTRELICIHCAFNKLKKDPNIQIKEIPEKCKECISDLENVIDNYKNYINIIINSMGHIDENKQNEEKKIIEIYEELSNLLITNRNNYLMRIEEIYQQNKNIMNKKLEQFKEIIEISEKLKEDFYTLHNKAPIDFNFLAQAFNQFTREINDKNNSEINIMQYNFSHDDLNKIIKYINNFADVKSKKKVFIFDYKKTEQENENDFYNFIDINNLNNDTKKNYFKKYFKVYKQINEENSKNIFNEYYINNNKYSSSTNLLKDSLYRAANIKNSNIENIINENAVYKYLKNKETFDLLKKYKIPLKLNKE